MATFKQKTYSQEEAQLFLDYLSVLTGIITKTKNLHWAAPRKNIHVYLDEFHSVASNFQDAIAEGYMGILGKMGPSDVTCIACPSDNAGDMIDYVIEKTKSFYDNIPSGTEFKGITSETETFIQESQKYKYLFSLCSE